jgi:putative transposase
VRCVQAHDLRLEGEAQKLRALEDENGRLKRLVADLSLDREMLKAVIAKNGLSS